MAITVESSSWQLKIFRSHVKGAETGAVVKSTCLFGNPSCPKGNLKFSKEKCVDPKIAKLVNRTSVTMVYDTYNELVNWVYKPTFTSRLGAPHCRIIMKCLACHQGAALVAFQGPKR